MNNTVKHQKQFYPTAPYYNQFHVLLLDSVIFCYQTTFCFWVNSCTSQITKTRSTKTCCYTQQTTMHTTSYQNSNSFLANPRNQITDNSSHI